MSFFPKLALTTVRQPPSLIAKCGACKLYLGCRSPKMPVHGDGKRSIMVIGEAPGELEDERNRPFIGKAGQKLREALNRCGVDLDRDCWTTNALICRPPKNKIPKPQMVDYCRPNVIQALVKYKPTTVILLGGNAIRSVIPYVWKDDTGGEDSVGKWVGWQAPSQKINAWVCPTFHPSYVLRMMDGPSGFVVERFFRDHIAAACNLEGRPWSTVPDYSKKVNLLKSPSDAVKPLTELRESGAMISFDYETNMLKPDSDKARIVCCAVSDGKQAWSYPWAGPAITATKELLEAPNHKIGFNIQFEDRWSRRFGIRVRNWKWCGMIATHILDNRPGICSFKFQSFVRLGMLDYDSHLEPYLKGAQGGNEENRIDEVDVDSLLLYCGLDAYGEFLLARQQMKEIE